MRRRATARAGRGSTSAGDLPERPVTQIAVDNSNYRIAYIAYAGFNPSTPEQPGHVFTTTDGGKHLRTSAATCPTCR